VFGIGGSEILVILIIALLFLGPDKLPDAAKQLSKVVRDLKKQSRVLQETVENDETIGGALRDIKSALRGDEILPRVKKAVNKIEGELKAAVVDPTPEEAAIAKADAEKHAVEMANQGLDPEGKALVEKAPEVTLPRVAGEHDPDSKNLKGTMDAGELAALIKPPAGETVMRGQPASDPKPDVTPEPAKSEHG
jgi:sec-independent protein translocase protein TatB